MREIFSDPMKVCHFTSAHESDDIRVFVKECCTLADAGYEVFLVAQGESREDSGVHVIGVGPQPESRRARMTKFAKTVYEKALSLDCDIYHFHDPELLPYGKKLMKKGKIVIYDSHEDVPAQIMDKVWIPKFMRKLISSSYRNYETKIIRKITAVVAATPHIASKMEGRANKVAVINNYPKLDDITYHTGSLSDRDSIVCYAGGISDVRGEGIMNEVMKKVDGKLIIAGDHDKEDRGNVSYIGKLDRNGVNDLYGRSVVGLCLLKPIENYYYAQPIKLYEYMTAGIPFVCSDFPMWRELATKSGAGIPVDPMDYDKIAEVINGLLADRNKSEEMGRSGHDYVVANCSWNNEGAKLAALYKELAG